MSNTPYPCTLRQLQYAVAVADALNFRLAAERCCVSQPSLSEQIGQLEALLGLRLFERSRRQVLLTSAGRAFTDRARLILRATDELVDFARRSGDPLSGKLNIGIIPTISPYLLPQLTPVLREAYPNLVVCWIEEKTRVLVQRLEAGSLDAALLALEADIGDLERATIAEDPFVVVAPRDHALAATRTALSVAELRGSNVLVLDEEHCFGQQAATFCAGRNAEIDAFRATSLTTLMQMVAEGAGVTMLPMLALAHETTGTPFCVRAITGEDAPRRTVGLVWRRQYPFDAALRELANAIAQAYPTTGAPPSVAGSWQRGHDADQP